MNKRAISRALSGLMRVCMLFGLTGCAAGGAGGTPTGSNGVQVATGTIIGFGSVIVNGIKYTRKAGLADDRVKLGFENNTGAREDNLRIGMIVTIRGSVNTNAGSGEYESIEFQPEIRGPLDDAALNGVDLINNRLKVMGRDIQVETNTTFDGIRDLAEVSSELEAGRHPELEVSGNLDNTTGVLHATRVARKAPDFGALTNKVVQIKGKITAATSGSFSIGNVGVNFTANALGPKTADADIAVGSIVEVKGTLNGSVITAARVEKKNAVEAGVNDNIRIKGAAVSGISNNAFTLNGPNGAIIVNTAVASFLKGGIAATSDIITSGTTLEVEGNILANGSIAATRISIEAEKTVKLEGNALAGAYNNNTLTLNGVPVAITTTTRLLDRDDQPLALSNIATGDHLQIIGFIDAGGQVNASQVQRTAASAVTFIRGPATSKTTTTLTILGITVDTGSITQADNFKDNRPWVTQAAVIRTLAESRSIFFAQVTTDGLTVVKVKGVVSGAVMSATEVELEQPQ